MRSGRQRHRRWQMIHIRERRTGTHPRIADVVVINAFLVYSAWMVRVIHLDRGSWPARHINQSRLFQQHVIEPHGSRVAAPYAEIQIALRRSLAVECVVYLFKFCVLETLKPAFNRSACPPLSNSRIWEYPRKFSVL